MFTRRCFNGAGMFLSRKSQPAWQSPRQPGTASMGPGCFYPGNRDHADTDARNQGASMGPGCFYPGNRFPRLCTWSPSFCFNGAGMFLSRKFGYLRDAACHISGFNGAGMFLSRKCQSFPQCMQEQPASMGPGCFYPGNLGTCVTPHATSPASMGPGCFYPGNVLLIEVQACR